MNPPSRRRSGSGGNLGDVSASLIRALRELRDSPGVDLRRVSSIYRTPPWGKLDQPSFLNMAALIETTLPARTLLALCLEIERRMGRRRVERWGPRTLDIDILTYGDLIIEEDDLRAPHPRIAERAFVLAPLRKSLPGSGSPDREVAELLALSDHSGIEIEPDATARARAALGVGVENK